VLDERQLQAPCAARVSAVRYAAEACSEIAGRQPAVIYKAKERFNKHLQIRPWPAATRGSPRPLRLCTRRRLVFPPLPSSDTNTRRLGGLQRSRRSVQLHTLIQHNMDSVGRVLFASIRTVAIDESSTPHEGSDTLRRRHWRERPRRDQYVVPASSRRMPGFPEHLRRRSFAANSVSAVAVWPTRSAANTSCTRAAAAVGPPASLCRTT